MKNKTVYLLIILLIIAIGYIAFLEVKDYREAQAEKQKTLVQAAYKQGTTEGYTYAITELIEKASDCNVVPVFKGNTTVNLVNVECIE